MSRLSQSRDVEVNAKVVAVPRCSSRRHARMHRCSNVMAPAIPSLALSRVLSQGGFGLVQVKSKLLLPDARTGQHIPGRGLRLWHWMGAPERQGDLVRAIRLPLRVDARQVKVGDFESVNVIGNVWVAGIRVFFN